jgi:ABC-type glycerol-3-phosphate transport system substrate-binding protein
MSGTKQLSRRDFLRGAALATAGALAAACKPQVVTEIVKETVEVEKAVEVEKEVEVEKLVTAVPAELKKVRVHVQPWRIGKQTSLYRFKEEYMAEFPDREVEYYRENFDFTPLALEASQGTSHIDLLFDQAPFITMMALVEGDVIIPIDDLIPEEWKGDVNQALLDECMYEGKQWVWPETQVVFMLAYQKSLLEGLGLEPPEAFDEYIYNCEEVQAKATLPDGSPVRGTTLDLLWWRAPTIVGMNMMGKDFFGEDNYMAWDDPRLVDVYLTLKKLGEYAPPEIFLPGGSCDEAFAMGQAAMQLGGNAMYTVMNYGFGLADLGLAVPPVFPGGEDNPRTTICGQGPSVMKHGDVEAAWHYWTWLWENEVFHETIFKEGSWLSTNKNYAEAEWVLPALKRTLEISRSGGVVPSTLHYLTLNTHARAILTDYLLGNIDDAEEAIALTKKNFEDAVAKGE